MRQRGAGAVDKVRMCLRMGDLDAASRALTEARQLAASTEPPLISPEELSDLQTTIDTMPAAAIQVLRYGPSSPFSALGVERLAQARSLNSVNRRNLLKKYRKLALQLHPDRCEHVMAIDAMQALNAAYDQLMASAQPAKRGGRPR